MLIEQQNMDICLENKENISININNTCETKKIDDIKNTGNSISILNIFKEFSNIFKKNENIYNNTLHYLSEKDFQNIDDFFCYSCKNGLIDNIDELIKADINPFKFNIKYNTNPFHLAVINNQNIVIDRIHYYFDNGYIAYDHDFYCPSWSLKKFKKGTCNFQICLFQGLCNEIISAFWSDETKNWIEL